MEKQLSKEEKQEALFQSWISIKDPEGNDFKFQSPEAEKLYKERATRLKDAIQMKKLPDRVPVTILPSMWPATYGGINIEESMYEYDKIVTAYRKFILDFDPDAHIGAAQFGPGKFFEMLDYKLYSWPGHGVAPEYSFQCNEGEYMTADEYDALIADPSGYFSSTYLPRVFGALEPWGMLPFLPGILEIYGVAFNFIPFGLPPVQTAYNTLFEAGAEAMKWAGAIGGLEAELVSLGYPQYLAGFTKAPFDVIGDTLRGTKGIMLDIYRQPDKLIEAMEALIPLMINMGVGVAQMSARPIVFIPLHKGADGFLSDEQFEKFYWPTLRKVMIGLIDEGCVPFPALEGFWNTRLEVIQDVPKGTTLWMVDTSDMDKAKETLGKNACLLGNVSSAMLNLSAPEEIKEYVMHLIKTAGKGGGFVVSNGAFFDHAKPENVKAMVETVKEHGAY